MELFFPKEVTILNIRFKVIKNKHHNGGSFSFGEGLGEIEIGVGCIKEDPLHTFGIVCHEVSEIIHAIIGTRYNDRSVKENFKFFMDHKEFQNHNTIFVHTISKFIK